MNTLLDVQKIVTNHLAKGGIILSDGAKNKDFSAAKRAEECFSEGLAKLKALKLSREDRYGMRLLRNAFEASIASTKALQCNQIDKSMRLNMQASDYAKRYLASLLKRSKSE